MKRKVGDCRLDSCGPHIPGLWFCVSVTFVKTNDGAELIETESPALVHLCKCHSLYEAMNENEMDSSIVIHYTEH